MTYRDMWIELNGEPLRAKTIDVMRCKRWRGPSKDAVPPRYRPSGSCGGCDPPGGPRDGGPRGYLHEYIRAKFVYQMAHKGGRLRIPHLTHRRSHPSIVRLRKFSAGKGLSLTQRQKQSARCADDPLTVDDHLDVAPNLDGVTATNTSLES